VYGTFTLSLKAMLFDYLPYMFGNACNDIVLFAFSSDRKTTITTTLKTRNSSVKTVIKWMLNLILMFSIDSGSRMVVILPNTTSFQGFLESLEEFLLRAAHNFQVFVNGFYWESLVINF
jgi:hypothetical protein